jgi:hypothetical protein
VIRRAALSAVALTVLGGVAVPALAAETHQQTGTGSRDYVYCVSLDNSKTGGRDGVCVWIPTN